MQRCVSGLLPVVSRLSATPVGPASVRSMLRASGNPARISQSGALRFSSTLGSIDASKISVSRTATPKPKLPKEKLQFGKSFTDHMLEVNWTSKDGWAAPSIHPLKPLEIHPASSSLHYGLQCFEGMKAYLGVDGHIRLFRPEMNMKRMNDSMTRLTMPSFDGPQFLDCIKRLVREDKDWIPEGEGYALYLRPTGIATHAWITESICSCNPVSLCVFPGGGHGLGDEPFLGVDAPASAKLFVIMSPVGPYYPEGFAPVSLYATREYVRAWPGGTGGSKVGGNYAPTILPQKLANKKGYTQVLWLFGDQVTEVGTMNFFVHWVNEQGKKELITAPLDGTILPGVTRQSALDVCRKWGEFEVTERVFTIDELVKAIKQGRVLEAFGCGTAAVVSPVKLVHYEGEDLPIPVDESLRAGPLAHKLWDYITGVQDGRIKDDLGWTVRID